MLLNLKLKWGGGLKNQGQIWLTTTPTSLCLRPKGSLKIASLSEKGGGGLPKTNNPYSTGNLPYSKSEQGGGESRS